MSIERTGVTMRPPGLVDVLDRILDKGLVIAGDIKVSLANVELLTLQIRLLVCSIDKAEQIGLNWWRYDPNLSSQVAKGLDYETLKARIAELEGQVRQLGNGKGDRGSTSSTSRPRRKTATTTKSRK